jgi:prepilin-type N-terminal cleavage/methylation domain-containing protein
MSTAGYITRARGFTIVELLTVVSIVAIVTAIAVPVITSALSQAKQATCISHLKQIGSGILLYVQDHDQRLPHLPSIDRPVTGEPAQRVWLRPYVLSDAVFRCPEDHREYKHASGVVYPTQYAAIGTSYAFAFQGGILDRHSTSNVLTHDPANAHRGGDPARTHVARWQSTVLFSDMRVEVVKWPEMMPSDE